MGRNHEIEVRVTGNVFKWPMVCPCCGVSLYKPKSGHMVSADYVAESKIDIRDFSPEYCEACSSHMTLPKKIIPVPGEPRRKYSRTTYASYSAVTWPLAAFAIGSISGSLAFGLIISMLGTATACVIGYYQDLHIHDAVVENYLKSREQTINHNSVVENSINKAMSKTCAGRNKAFRTGTIHRQKIKSLFFGNSSVAQRFQDLNKGKVVN